MFRRPSYRRRVTGSVLLASPHQSRIHALASIFAAEGLAVVGMTSTDEVLDADLDGDDVQVLVVDAAFPNGQATILCQRARAVSTTLSILVVGDRPTADPIEFLERGADGYVRPDRERELVARVRALLRRTPRVLHEEAGPNTIAVGDVVLDQDRHEVTVRGRPVTLPLKQFQLLELFLMHPGQVLTRPTILRRVWGVDSTTDSNTLEVQVKRLRSRIEDDPSSPTRVKTVRGLGYMYDPG